ncbi:MAG: hypothetical protein ACP6IP_10350 [Candidatus Njordarchaeia archaeon]
MYKLKPIMILVVISLSLSIGLLFYFDMDALKKLEFDFLSIEASQDSLGMKLDVRVGVYNPSNIYVFTGDVLSKMKSSNSKVIKMKIKGFVIPPKKSETIVGTIIIPNNTIINIKYFTGMLIKLKDKFSLFKNLYEKIIDLLNRAIEVKINDIKFGNKSATVNLTIKLPLEISGLKVKAEGQLLYETKQYMKFKTMKEQVIDGSETTLTLIGNITNKVFLEKKIGELVTNTNNRLKLDASIKFYNGTNCFMILFDGIIATDFGIKIELNSLNIIPSSLTAMVNMSIINQYTLNTTIVESKLIIFDNQNEEILAVGEIENVDIYPCSTTTFIMQLKFNSTNTLLRFLTTQDKSTEGSYIKLVLGNDTFTIPIEIKI